MTYSNTETRNPPPFTRNLFQSNDAYFTALAPAFRAVLAVGVLLFSRLCRAMEDSFRYNCDHSTRKFKIASLAVILFMIVLPGTREEKQEFFDRMFERLYAKRNARLKNLRAAYIIWRQRKCWMWAGGFRNLSLSYLTDVFAGAPDKTSFDALIPDWS